MNDVKIRKFGADRTNPGQIPITPSLLRYVGRLRPGPYLVGRIGSGVWVSVGFRKEIAARFCPTTKSLRARRVVSGD